MRRRLLRQQKYCIIRHSRNPIGLAAPLLRTQLSNDHVGDASLKVVEVGGGGKNPIPNPVHQIQSVYLGSSVHLWPPVLVELTPTTLRRACRYQLLRSYVQRGSGVGCELSTENGIKGVVMLEIQGYPPPTFRKQYVSQTFPLKPFFR